jgi:hypothetical protein
MQGVVERIEQQGKRTALKIGGQWYSTFEPIGVSEGDRVEFAFKTVKKNGREYRNLTSVETLESDRKARAAKAAEELHKRSQEINRAVALKAALHWAEIAEETEVGTILKQADGFLGWLEEASGNRRNGEEF